MPLKAHHTTSTSTSTWTTSAPLRPPFSPDIILLACNSSNNASSASTPSPSSPSQSQTPISPSTHIPGANAPPNGAPIPVAPQPETQPTASQPLLTPYDSLPTLFGRANTTTLVADDIPGFLAYDLNLSRLNRIHRYLWMAGRPMRARPLHRYKLMGQEITHTQQLDLHLLKFTTHLLVKPLPEYLLSYDFWEKWLCGEMGIGPGPGTRSLSSSMTEEEKTAWEKKRETHACATGFLLSYIWLIVSPLDLLLAQTHHLVPPHITFPQWKAFVASFTAHIDLNTIHSLNQVNKRFHFGDLRLGRVNSIYRMRFFYSHFVRGYLWSYNRYTVFFERNFSWMLVVCVFFSLVLSAMQVGVTVKELGGEGPEAGQGNVVFLRSTYGFVVFSMVVVAAVLGVVGLVFALVFFFNMVSAIRHDKEKRRERKRAKKEKKMEKEGLTP